MSLEESEQLICNDDLISLEELIELIGSEDFAIFESLIRPEDLLEFMDVNDQ